MKSKSMFRILLHSKPPEFSQPTLIADGDNDEAYETPADKRAPLIPRTNSMEFSFPTLDPKASPKKPGVSDLEAEDQDQSTPLPSPTKKYSLLVYHKHRRNQLSVSLMKTYLHVPAYELGTQPLTPQPDFHVKIVVVGDGGCGKTCLLVSYSQGEFPTLYVPTVFENYVAHVTTPEGKTVELALWDTAGQEEYDRLRPLSYPDADIFLVCYAMDSAVSLNNVKQRWFPEVLYFCPGVPVILVGLKSDLYEGGQTPIDRRVTKSVAREIGAVAHVECSAKTMFNVKTVFSMAIDTVLKKLKDPKKSKRFSAKPNDPESEVDTLGKVRRKCVLF